MINKDEYLKRINLLELSELDKVKHLSFHLFLLNNKNEFQFSDVPIWFESLNLSIPNVSRLKTKIKSSRDFISKTSGKSFSLHAKTLEQLKTEVEKLYSVKHKTKIATHHYVNLNRIDNLKKLNSKFDLSRLIRMCEEINSSFDESNFLSVCMLLRAILDHVPPVFGCNNFSEIANNYSGSKSFKESMKRLSESSRKIADMYLHVQIRSKESLPNNTQVDFSNELDVLLSEIIRIL